MNLNDWLFRPAQFHIETSLPIAVCLTRLEPMVASPLRASLLFGTTFKATADRVVVGCNYTPNSALSPILDGAFYQQDSKTQLRGRFTVGPFAQIQAVFLVIFACAGIGTTFLGLVARHVPMFLLGATFIAFGCLFTAFSVHSARNDLSNLKRSLTSALDAHAPATRPDDCINSNVALNQTNSFKQP